MKQKQYKPKTCKQCKNTFTPERPFQAVFGPLCAVSYTRSQHTAKRVKAERAQLRKRRDALKSRSDWLKELQSVFNRFIRLRDLKAGHPCISCQRHDLKKVNAGHYLSVGAHPELRFNEHNCHLQCEHCNTYKAGNQALYRTHLVERIGQDAVDRLEGPHEPAKWTVDEIKELKAFYRAKIKAIQAE